MKIEVNRSITPEDDLIFTIRVSEPHHAAFGEVETKIMSLLDSAKDKIEIVSPEENRVKNDALRFIHSAKETIFLAVLENLKFAIRHQLEPKMDAICQEIYNWIYDYQDDRLKIWMSEFDPQRTTYYFDDDVRLQDHLGKRSQVDEYISDDKVEDEDDDN